MSKLGVIFAGGGGKGAYQIGVWKALKEHGIDRNVGAISGTSVGALNAVSFLQGDYDLAEKIWLNISHEKILKLDVVKWLQSISSSLGSIMNKSVIETFLRTKISNGIFSREGLLQIINQYINLNVVSSSYIKCYITCCHLPSLKPIYFDISGESSKRIKKILLATSALPLIFDTETIDDENYIDGGVVDNVPITPLYNDGYRTFLVIHLSRESVIDTRKFPDSKIIQIVPKLHQGALFDGTLDFNSSNARIRIIQGYEDTKRVLQPLYELGMVQTKITQSLNQMSEDNFRLSNKRVEILNKRHELLSEMEEVMNNGWSNNGTPIKDGWGN